MSEREVCRICLRTDVKMYNFNKYQLKFYYEEIMASQVNESDGLPYYFCYECATILYKFHKFKEKCFIGQKILKQMLWKGPITYESLRKIDFKDEIFKTLSKSNYSSLTIKPVRNKKAKNNKKHMSKENNDASIKMESDCSDTSSLDKEDICVFNEAHTIKITENNHTIVDEENILRGTENEISDNETDISETVSKIESNEVFIIESTLEENVTDDDKMKVDDTNLITCIAETKDASKLKKDVNGENKLVKKWSHRILDNTKNWKIIILSDEEAMKEFKAKETDKKYTNAAFKCGDCFKGFSKKDMLNRHFHLRHVEELGNFVCHFCKYRYRIECYLKKHMKEHFSRYQCLRCNLLCPLENSAVLHDEYHSGVTKKCVYCDQEFKYSSTYYTHLRTHRSKHVCTLCGASFVSQMGLKQHRRIKHVINEIESPDDDEEVDTYCKRCDIRFETRKAYEEHLFHSALHVDEEESKTEDVKKDREENITEDLDIKRNNSTEKVAACKKILGKKEQRQITKQLKKLNNDTDPFNSNQHLKRRYKKRERKLRSKPTTCYQCGKHFETQSACMKHHMAAHPRTSFFSPNERYICEICGAYLAPGSIANHQNMHTKEKMHTCSTCGRQFHNSIGLKRHLVTHTGEKPFGCPLCDKRFTQNNSMKLHYKTFHLKQPYPKRNRQPKIKESKKSQEVEESNSEDASEDSLPSSQTRKQTGIEPANNVVLDRAEDSMHYLTLT